MRYFVAILWIKFMVSLIDDLGNCSVLRSLRLLLCIMSLTPNGYSYEGFDFPALGLLLHLIVGCICLLSFVWLGQ